MRVIETIETGGRDMPCNIKTDFGLIAIDKEVVARIAGMAAMQCYGVVGMAAKGVKDMKDDLVHMLGMENLTKGIKLWIKEDDSLVINLHIIAEYGTNLSAISESLIRTVRYAVQTHCGLKVGRVNVYVEGLRVHG